MIDLYNHTIPPNYYVYLLKMKNWLYPDRTRIKKRIQKWRSPRTWKSTEYKLEFKEFTPSDNLAAFFRNATWRTFVKEHYLKDQ